MFSYLAICCATFQLLAEPPPSSYFPSQGDPHGMAANNDCTGTVQTVRLMKDQRSTLSNTLEIENGALRELSPLIMNDLYFP